MNNMVKSETPSNQSLLHSLSISIIDHLEGFFYWYGVKIAKRPYHFILLCLSITAIMSVGLLRFRLEERPFKLWIPQNSDAIKGMNWQAENFPPKFRLQAVLYEAENVLKKSVILEMYKVHELVSKMSTSNATWSTVCAKVPVIPESIFRFKRSSPEKANFNQRSKRELPWFTAFFTREQMCDLIESVQQECIEHSILEIWGYDFNKLNSLTDQDIINDLNTAEKSAVFGVATNFSQFVGLIKRNETGHIIGAKAFHQLFLLEINMTAINLGDRIDDRWTGMVVDSNRLEWENKFVSVLHNASKNSTVKFYYMSSSSFGDISQQTILGDAKFFGLGFSLVFVYAQLMLGKFNMVEMRPLLSFFGLSCITLAVGVSFGICCLFGIMFGPVNMVLPFLVLGLGVDDMFVIIQAFNNLESDEKSLELPTRIGLTLKNAGVSITVTSVTDFVAFAIGATSVLPALKAFCLYAAVGIASVYFFQATFFVAWLTLDQRRLENKRNGLFWCIKYENFVPNQCSQRDLCQSFFENFFSTFILKLPVKVFVIIFTFALLGVSCWGVYNLEQEFDPIWFLPHKSYLFQYFKRAGSYFSSFGIEGLVLVGENFTLLEDIPKLENITESLKENQYVGVVNSWYDAFKDFWRNDLEYDVNKLYTNESDFLDKLSQFLFTPQGSKYRVKNFIFDGDLNCTSPAPNIKRFTVDFTHLQMHGTSKKIEAMEQVKSIVRAANYSGFAQPWCLMYSGLETDKIILTELYRNLGLAIVIVGIMTLGLIASLKTSLVVLICVLFSLIDVMALMHWWGLTIDTVSCIDIVLAIGLCVDYAAHVGHTFMTQNGTRNERAKKTLAKIGPAVLNGGTSTIIAFIFLARSDSHVFMTFFKVFFGVSMYGLFHGLVFLPVVLSIIGPDTYSNRRFVHHTESSEKHESLLLNGPENLHPNNEKQEILPLNGSENVHESLLDTPHKSPLSFVYTPRKLKPPFMNQDSFDDILFIDEFELRLNKCKETDII